ncbi:MAG: hypothetical protein ACOYN0_11325, partial [Phycisphaerales bacterium]
MFAVLVAYALLTRSFVARAIVMGQLSAATGADASCDSVRLTLSGRAEMTGLVMNVPGVSGTAGRFVEIQRLSASVSPMSLLTGRPKVLSVELVAPRVRISQSLADGAVNVASLGSPATGSTKGGKGPGVLPRIVLTGGVIELGEHAVPGASDGYRRVTEVAVSGEVEASQGATGESVIAFRQVDAAGNPTGLLDIRGTVSDRGVALTVGDLDLSKVDPANLPAPLRETVTKLSLTGLITGTEFRYGFDGEFSAAANLAGVGMSLPVEARPSEDEHEVPQPMEKEFIGRRLRIDGVTGRASLEKGVWSGELRATVEELPCKLGFEWKGTDAESPFTITMSVKDFDMNKKPALVRFAPPVAQLRFSQFGDPTGVVTAELRFWRDPPAPGGTSEVKSSGVIDIVNGSSAFHKFPYRFYEMTGRVTFDDDAIRGVGIKGVAPNGAKLSAELTLIPPWNPEAMIRVSVDDVPTDDTLRAAMGPRARVIEELFSRRAYGVLLERGLVRKPGSAGNAPVFEPGGLASLVVEVTRVPLADDLGDWHDTVTVHFPEVGVLPDAFPLPMIGRDITLVKKDFDATISGGTYSGLTGGSAEITALADLKRLDDPSAEFIPEVTVAARGVPTDELLIQALPVADKAFKDGRTLPEVVRSIGLRGTIAGDIQVGMGAAGETEYDAKLSIRGGEAIPDFAGADGAILSDMTGTFRVDQNHLETRFRADVLKTSEREGQFPRSPAGSMEFAARYEFSGDQGLDLTLAGTRMDLGAPFEGLLRPISADAAESVAKIRADHNPTGVADLQVKIDRSGEGPVSVTATARSAAAEFAVLGTRLGIANMQGAATLRRDRGGPPTVIFDAFGADLSAGEAVPLAPAGRWTIDGPLALEGAAPGVLTINALGAKFDSPLLLAASQRGSSRVRDAVTSFAPAGEFDADLKVEGDRIEGSLRPKSLAVTLSGARTVFPAVEGEVGFEGDRVELRGVKLRADGWSVGIGGAVTTTAAEGVDRDLTVDVEADSLRPELTAVLPAELRDVLTDLEAQVRGPVRVSGAKVRWKTDPSGREVITANPRVTVEGLDADVGAGLTGYRGDFAVDFNKAGEAPPRFRIEATGAEARVSGLRVTNATALIKSVETDGTATGAISAEFAGESHGGRVSGEATVAAKDQKGRREFGAEIRLADLRFASVLEDLSALGGESGATPAPD